MPTPTPRVAVVGHVEWAEFARVERLPAPGEIVHAHEAFEAPAGGGAVAAVQLARLAGDCLFLTALADDELGHRASHELRHLGHARALNALVHLDGNGERTITVIGERLGPRRDDPLPWPRLGSCDAVYLTAGDAGAVRAARAARSLVATVRAIDALATAGVELDVLVASGEDAGERYSAGDVDPSPRFVVRTAGASGGSLETADGRQVHWEAPPLPGPAIDAYGAGDSFAAGLTYGLALGLSPEEAVTLGSRCGAACVTGRGPYEGQLRGPLAP